MKPFLRILFFLLISTNLFSQSLAESKVTFLDSCWTESSAENYKYIRIVEDYYTDKKLYVYKEYYKSKVLKSIGTTLDRDVIRKEGQFISYYENGNKQSNVNFVKTKKSGKEFNWYENGNIKSEIEYFENKKGDTEYKINNFWNPQKKQTIADGNGDYSDTEEHSEESGRIKNGFPDGIWKGKNLKMKSTFTENYENGKLISGVTIDSLNVEHPYTVKNQPPSPKKGINSFYSYVGKSMYIPNEARNKVYGKIYLTFIVDKEGNLVEPKIIKGLGYGLDENAISLIKGAKKWIPGTIRGVPVQVLYSLPITIAKNGY
ncbi:Antitoxin component YwqK of the YwqJK toxin-antitoxin module [Flavobacterium aquidurense]|uniref:Energy transducer TonB n=1 Tax=Flavobacterium frigidimaris TaxID=262320 RepID=A0ABX4BS18_FLAFR|nr:energy transducer TonB [Flavobacterium frigidimaris]OXA79879.1 energy transducer TonB [Flavobacterium frigidimaris]SDZ39562.1 Antitoxin component YwqK of the YwqJK toxin-antitoxin module [Flavobacterium aquidurense]